MRNLPKTEFGDTVHIICRGTARRALRLSFSKFHNLDCHSRANGTKPLHMRNLPKTEFGDTVHIICRGTARRAPTFFIIKIS